MAVIGSPAWRARSAFSRTSCDPRAALVVVDGPQRAAQRLAPRRLRAELARDAVGLVESPRGHERDHLFFEGAKQRSPGGVKRVFEGPQLAVRRVAPAQLREVPRREGELTGAERAAGERREHVGRTIVAQRLHEAERLLTSAQASRREREPGADGGLRERRGVQGALDSERVFVGAELLHEQIEERHGGSDRAARARQGRLEHGARRLVVVVAGRAKPVAEEPFHGLCPGRRDGRQRSVRPAPRPPACFVPARWPVGGDDALQRLDVQSAPHDRSGLFIELCEDGVARRGARRTMPEQDDAAARGSIRHDLDLAREALDEQALKPALEGVSPRPLRGRQVQVRRIDGAHQRAQRCCAGSHPPAEDVLGVQSIALPLPHGRRIFAKAAADRSIIPA